MNLISLGSCLGALLLLAGPVLGQAAIEGRVQLPPPTSGGVVNQRYSIVTKGGIMQPDPPLAIVYLEGPTQRVAPTGVVQMAQKGLAFQPAILAIQVGTKVEFPNQDDSYHNVFSYSPVKRFDLGRYRPDEQPVPAQVFDKPGLVTLHCDIHDHMRALILVLETPHFIRTGTDGRFKLAGLPAGSYVLKAWLNSRTTLERKVELRSGQTLHVDFP